MDRVISDSPNRITNPYDPPEHNGVDLGWRYDEEENRVFANCYGTVVDIQRDQPHKPGSRKWGNYVLVRHLNGMESRYAHLQNNIPVNVGDVVDEFIQIGTEGDSGDAEFRHLHFEVWNNGNRIDPTPYLTEPIAGRPEPEPIPPTPDYFEYQIQEGDTLSEIAEKFNTTVNMLVLLNGIDNPDLIYAGDFIKVPNTKEEYYTIKDGDTLSEIAEKFNTTVDELVRLNNIENPDLIYAGDTIRIR